ncbi:unnamed protein product [Gulo gulo]|uniref:Uncharacterized protein n=1 Tax=Gulo gulo TaxID=48420 RepID=A0A9X9QBG0_GULGU|nr:unnamed protein product [Gulo gulo]
MPRSPYIPGLLSPLGTSSLLSFRRSCLWPRERGLKFIKSQKVQGSVFTDISRQEKETIPNPHRNP